MRVIETKVYTFAELSDSAKEVALENYREINTHGDWYEPIYEGFKEEAEEAGFEVGDIFFSGFYSQGDGAMFEYNRFNDSILKNFVAQLTIKEEDKVIILSQGDTCGKGIHRGHYYHENSCDHYTTLDSTNPDWEYATDLISQHEDAFEEYVIETYKDLCRELFRDLREYYEELTSDDYVQETIEDNEWEFLESGQTL
jgi:hypothetical protein